MKSLLEILQIHLMHIGFFNVAFVIKKKSAKLKAKISRQLRIVSHLKIRNLFFQFIHMLSMTDKCQRKDRKKQMLPRTETETDINEGTWNRMIIMTRQTPMAIELL